MDAVFTSPTFYMDARGQTHACEASTSLTKLSPYLLLFYLNGSTIFVVRCWEGKLLFYWEYLIIHNNPQVFFFFHFSSAHKRKPLPKTVYNLLSDRDLKKKLKQYGLSIQGNRQQLIKRHQEFVHMYNSQCDALHPKSGKVIHLFSSLDKEVCGSEIINHRKNFNKYLFGSRQDMQVNPFESYLGKHCKGHSSQAVSWPQFPSQSNHYCQFFEYLSRGGKEWSGGLQSF